MKQITSKSDELNASVTARSWVDWMGMITSGICLVHCWALPLLLVALPGLSMHERLIHPLLGSFAILSTILFIKNNHHRYSGRHVMAALITGNLLILFTILLAPSTLSHTTETGLNTAGGMFLVFAHYKSFRSLRLNNSNK